MVKLILSFDKECADIDEPDGSWQAGMTDICPQYTETLSTIIMNMPIDLVNAVLV